ncbi:LysM peptidoglycan-binding domain-containing protein [Streptomyces sp. NPDC020681]|uniref:LysM peptidoglycan-binding domain-containing protein n=1 Tax=Streptomyces sp. NPDC020681 TaxID=3365083 RepID=UPI00378E2851
MRPYPAHSPAPRNAGLVARLVRALVSLVALVAVLGGLPWLLWHATWAAVPAGMDDLTHLLTRQDTTGVFILTLAAVGWIGWASFTLSLLVEIPAQLRGRTTPRLPGFRIGQRAAATLVGGLLVLLPTGTAIASPAASPTLTAEQHPGQTRSAPTTDRSDIGQPAAAPASRAAGTRTYTVRDVRPAESLWQIAEDELGSGELFTQILTLNAGRTMVDGTTFTAHTPIQPGWTLMLPADTAAPAEPSASDQGPAPQLTGNRQKADDPYTVEPGDYLSKIAQEQLGDGDRWTEVYNANRGAITNPDLIFPGQRLELPAHPSRADHRGGRDHPAGPADSAESPGKRPDNRAPHSDALSPVPSPSGSRAGALPRESPSPEQSRSTGTDGDRAAPTRAASPDRDPQPAPTSVTPGPSAHPSSSATPDTAEPVSTLPASHDVRTVAGAFALLAAAITGALALRRLLQRRHRKPGERIAIAQETSPAEAQMAQASDSSGATRLDRALRTLAHHARQNGQELPALRAARIRTGSVEVLTADESAAPSVPFTTGHDGWWALTDDTDLPPTDITDTVPAPYPGLATIGATEDGDLLLINLPHIGVLLLEGDRRQIEEVCTALVLELGMSPWSSSTEIVTVGFGEHLPRLLPTSRIAHMRQPAHAAHDFTERLLEAHQLPNDTPQPYLLLAASELDADSAWQIAETLGKAAPAIPVALIAPAATSGMQFPEAEILNASLDEAQEVECVGVRVVLQRLEQATYQQISTALAVSGMSPQPAAGPWRNVPAEPTSSSEPDGFDTPSPHPATEVMDSPPVSSIGDPTLRTFAALAAAADAPARSHLHPASISTPPVKRDAGPRPAATTPPAPEDPDSASDDAAGAEARDLHAPEIRLLGPVELARVTASSHGPRQAQLAALLLLKPGRTADTVCSDMDPNNPWSLNTLNARVSGLRRSLGNDPDGTPYVPRRTSKDDAYRISPRVRCDWDRFQQLAERALPQGPAGLPDLERALSLVRGRPFGTRPLPWSEPYAQEMITRIVDVAHTVAAYRTPPGQHHDLAAARRAIATGLDVDDSSELLYRDWMRIEHSAGSRSGLHTAITRLHQANRSLDCPLEHETEQLIHDLLGNNTPPYAQGL